MSDNPFTDRLCNCKPNTIMSVNRDAAQEGNEGQNSGIATNPHIAASLNFRTAMAFPDRSNSAASGCDLCCAMDIGGCFSQVAMAGRGATNSCEDARGMYELDMLACGLSAAATISSARWKARRRLCRHGCVCASKCGRNRTRTEAREGSPCNICTNHEPER